MKKKLLSKVALILTLCGGLSAHANSEPFQIRAIEKHGEEYQNLSDQELIYKLNTNTLKAALACGVGTVATVIVGTVDTLPFYALVSHVPALAAEEPSSGHGRFDNPGKGELMAGSFFGGAAMTLANAVTAGWDSLHNERVRTGKIKAGFYGASVTYDKFMDEGSSCDNAVLKAEAARTILEARGRLSEKAQK